MYNFIFTVLVITLLLFINTLNAMTFKVLHGCDVTKPLFPDATNEIHAMLARDRYVNFTGWLTLDGIKNAGNLDVYYVEALKYGWTEDISYGYLKEMVLHLSTLPNNGEISARVFLTSGKEKIMFIWEIEKQNSVQYRERFFRFTVFEDGITVIEVNVMQNGTQSENNFNGCRQFKEGYTKEDYSQIDGLLIAIDCKTTNVNKILVKVNPKS